MAEAGKLSQVWIYPVKSCRRVALDVTTVVDTGLAGDRVWQVVDKTANAITQRSHKNMALVHVEQTPDEGLTLSLPNGTASGAVNVPPVAEAPDSVTVKALAGDEVRCADAGEEAAEFFSDLLDEPARLVGFTRTTRRPSLFGKDKHVSFVDATSLTVANTASLTDLEAIAGTSFGMERFRPNLVIETTLPWVEDTWDRFSIGNIQFQAHMPWPRCAVPQINQDTADRTSQPARVLKEHRWCEDASAAFPNNPGIASMLENNALFAVSCSVTSNALENTAAKSTAAENTVQLRVGDPVRVESHKPPVLTPPNTPPNTPAKPGYHTAL